MGLTCERIHGSQIQVVHSGTRSTLIISFQRTIRFPDKDRVWELPEGLGRFPLYPVDQYKRTLPKDIAAKGGLILPMYQKEAMYIDFSSDESFAVKIYAGDANVVSGEPMHEPLATQRRRSSLKAKNQSLQDYVVTPKQTWLAGFATAPGKVRQLVAMPLGSGASTKTQATGGDFNGSIQFEVTPRRCRTFLRTKGILPTGQVFLKVLTGATITIECHTSKTTISEIKECVEEAVGTPVDEQCLVYAGRQLEDGKSYTPFFDRHILDDYDIEQGSTINILPRLRGGQPDESPVIVRKMKVAPGGFIEQSIMQDTYPPEIWDHGSTVLFNVQILNSAVFSRATGFPPPPSPVSAAIYVHRGIPLYDLYEERPPISRASRNIRSLLGFASREDAADLGSVRTVELNPKGPAKKFRTVSDLEREIEESNTVAIESNCGTDASPETARSGAVIRQESPRSGLYPGSAESPTSDPPPGQNTTPETRSPWPSAPQVHSSSRRRPGAAATLASFTTPLQDPPTWSSKPSVPSPVISTPQELRLVTDAFHFRSLPLPPAIAFGTPWLTAANLYADAMAPHPNYQIWELSAGGVGSRSGRGRVSSEQELKLVKDLFRIRRLPIRGVEIGSQWSAVAASYEGFIGKGSCRNSQGMNKTDRKHKRKSLLAGIFRRTYVRGFQWDRVPA